MSIIRILCYYNALLYVILYYIILYYIILYYIILHIPSVNFFIFRLFITIEL